MNPVLKRRLMIAVIIVALVVIFVPVPFGKYFSKNAPKDLKMVPTPPAQPAVQPLTQSQAKQVVSGFVPEKSSQNTKMVQQDEVAPLPLSSQAPKPTHTTSTMPQTLRTPTTAMLQHEHAAQTVSSQSTHPLVVQQKSVVAKVAPHHAPSLAARHHAVQSHAVSHKVAKKMAENNSPVVDQIDNGSQGHSVIVTEQAFGFPIPQVVMRQSTASSNNAGVPSDVTSAQTSVQQHHLALAQKNNVAWVAQLGSFPDAVQSEQVVKRLQAKGLTAFTYKKTVSDKTMYRIYVGPFLTESQAKDALGKVSQHSRMKGYVHHFHATKTNE